MSELKKIKVVEVGPRDGLQNEKSSWSVDQRVELLQRLCAAGVQFIEGGSFVSAKAIPQMQNSDAVYKATKQLSFEQSYLVPNIKGLDAAIQAGVRRIAVFTATSETFTQKNIGKSVADSLVEYRRVSAQAIKAGLSVRGYVSTALGCPYEGAQSVDAVARVTGELFDMGCDEVSIGDTIGVGLPGQVFDLFKTLTQMFDQSKLAGHFHDTRGFALVNIRAALDQGIRTFDASVAGLGGCPYAEGASGNVATEEVVLFLESMGFQCDIDVQKLLEIAGWVENQLDRPLKAKLYLSKPKALKYI